jgi:hypothetical protein
MTTKCPKCGSEELSKWMGGWHVVYECVDCECEFTHWQQAEIERLRGVLREIAEHPHCDAIDFQEYYTQHAEGHRCAAEIVRKGLEGK